MPRPSNTETRRAQIVDAFLSLMAERGYDGASINAVAQLAGLNQGLVHYHFKGKEAVLLEALRTLTRTHLARLDDAYEAAGPAPLSRVYAFLEFHLGLGAHADPRALACWVGMGAEASRRPALAAVYLEALEALRARLLEALEAAHASGAITHPDPAAAAAALLALVQGYFQLAASAPGFAPGASAAISARAMADGLLHPTEGGGQ